MSAVILQFPTRQLRGAAVADAVRRAAHRMGYRQHHADRAAALARQDFIATGCAARAISDMVGALKHGQRSATGGAA